MLIARNKHPEMHRICICQYCLSRDIYDLDDLCDRPPEENIPTLNGADREKFDENDPLIGYFDKFQELDIITFVPNINLLTIIV